MVLHCKHHGCIELIIWVNGLVEKNPFIHWSIVTFNKLKLFQVHGTQKLCINSKRSSPRKLFEKNNSLLSPHQCLKIPLYQHRWIPNFTSLPIIIKSLPTTTFWNFQTIAYSHHFNYILLVHIRVFHMKILCRLEKSTKLLPHNPSFIMLHVRRQLTF